MTLAAHYLLDFSWQTAGLLGAALAPTDPAVMFSVFGRNEIGGRTGTILEGESGANDPVGIALMLAAVSLAQEDSTSVAHAVGEFVLGLGVGVVFGVAGAYVLLAVAPRSSPKPRALSAADTRACRGDLRARDCRARLRVPRGLHRGDPDRRRRHSREARDRALPHVAREPRGDRCLRRARPDDRPHCARRRTNAGSTGSCSRSCWRSSRGLSRSARCCCPSGCHAASGSS